MIRWIFSYFGSVEASVWRTVQTELNDVMSCRSVYVRTSVCHEMPAKQAAGPRNAILTGVEHDDRSRCKSVFSRIVNVLDLYYFTIKLSEFHYFYHSSGKASLRSVIPLCVFQVACRHRFNEIQPNRQLLLILMFRPTKIYAFALASIIYNHMFWCRNVHPYTKMSSKAIEVW